MSQPFQLYRLQQIDSQLDRVKARLAEIEKLLSDDETLRVAEKRFNEAEESLSACRKALKRAEEAVQDQHLKIEQTESTLYSGKVHNPKELQDMQHEAAALKRYRAVLEDHQLETMIDLELAEKNQADVSVDLENARLALAQKNSGLVSEQTNLLKDVARLEAERNAACNPIPPADLNLYEQLRKQRKGIAVVKVSNKACAACGSVLNAALFDAAHSPNQITRCDNCGRILYVG